MLFGAFFLLSSCQFSPTSTTVTITNDTNVEIVYWLEYRLGFPSPYDFDTPAPSLLPGQSWTYDITGKLSAIAEKENGLWVGALSKKALEDLRKSEYSSSIKDWWIITEHGVKEDYDAAESYINKGCQLKLLIQEQ